MKIFLYILTASIILIYPAITSADIIYLKSGEKIIGKIVVSSEESIWIQIKDGKYTEFSAGEIQRIEKDSTAPEAITKGQ